LLSLEAQIILLEARIEEFMGLLKDTSELSCEYILFLEAGIILFEEHIEYLESVRVDILTYLSQDAIIKTGAVPFTA
jgi:hypothetical protein